MSPPQSVQELDLSLTLRSDAVLSRIDLSSVERAADLGCATGTFAARVARAGPTVTAIDISEDNLAQLERLHGELVVSGRLKPALGDLTALPLESASQEVVFCLEVLEHVEDHRAALRETARVLEPEGRLVLSVPNRDAPRPLVERLGLSSVHDEIGPERHVREGYRGEELRQLLTEAGYRHVEIGGVGGSIFRLATGVVSLAHLGYRRARGQTSWTWADVEEDSQSPAVRVYARVFPLLAYLVRRERTQPTSSASTLIATAVRTS